MENKKCSVNTQQVINYIKDRTSKDAKFKNFDEVAKDILNTKGQPDDAKMIVLKALALMYKSLALKNPEFVIDSKADKIINTELQSADLISVHSDVRKVYFPSAPKLGSFNTIEDINKAIEDFKEYNDYEIIDGSKTLFTAIGNMMKRSALTSKMEMKNNLLYTITRFEQVLSENTGVLDQTKKIISNKLGTLKEDIKTINTYIDLSATKYGEAFRVRNKEGKLLDQIFLDQSTGKYFSIGDPSREVDVAGLKRMGFAVDPIVYGGRTSSRFETVDNGRVRLLSNSEITTGFKLTDFTDENAKKRLLALSNPNLYIKVFASRSNIKQNQERLARLQETLPVRNHETFESYEQQLALRDGNSVAAVSSPTTGVSLRIEILGTNAMAFINDLSNYALVNPDNSTFGIDFTDLSKRDVIKQYFKKRGPNNTALDLSDYDLDRLVKLQSVINQFKQTAEDFLNKSGEDDIELPAEMYRDVISLVKTGFSNMEAMVSKENEGAILSSALENENNKKWMVTVDVVKFDEETEEIIGREQREVPLLVKKVQGKWEYVNGVLAENEMVDYDGEFLPLEVYLDTVYPEGKDVSSMVSRFPSHIGYAIVLNKTEESNRYQPVGMNRDYGADPVMNFLKFVNSLEMLKQEVSKNPADQNRILKRFNIENYSFSPSHGWGADLASYVNKKNEVSFHYEIRPLADKSLGGSKELKAASRLTFPQELMSAVNSIVDKSTNTEKFKSFLGKYYPQFGTVKDLYDSKTGEKGRIYFEVVTKYIENNPDLQREVEAIYDKFTNQVAKNLDYVSDKFKKLGYALPKIGLTYTMLENENPDFTGRWFLKVNDKSVGLNYMNLDQFRLVTGEDLAKATNFSLASPIATYMSTASVVEPVTEVAPVKTEQKTEKADPVINENNNNTDHQITDFDDNIFSLVPVGTEVVTYDDKTYKSELDWFKRNMPADINIKDLEHILDNLKAEGRVLGYYKDLAAYVSKNISAVGSIYHEAFHGIFRNVLSPAQRQFYTSKALQEIGNVTKEDVKEFRETRKLFHLSDAGIIQRIAEEYIADKFKAYKLKKSEPKQAWLRKLLNLIDKLVSFFTSKGKDIDSLTELFKRIDNGYYKNATVVKDFKGEGVFELIPSRPVITGTKEDGKPLIRKTNFNTYEQNQLMYRLAFEISNSPVQGFDNKFKVACSKLMEEYDVERLVAEHPELEDKIRDHYTDLYADIRFALGDPFSTYKNISGNESHDALISDSDKQSLGVTDMLKAEVKNIIDKIDVKNAITNDQFELTEDDEDSQMSGAYEDNYANLNPLDGLSTQFRKFFSLIPYNHLDKNTGINVTKMVDGGRIFDAIMKISADVPFEEMISNLKSTIDSLKDDGNLDAYEKLNTVYEYLNVMLGLTEDFKPTKNFNFYNQFINTFFVTEIPTLIYHPTTHSEYGTRGGVYDATIQRDISREVEKLKVAYTANFFRMAPQDKERMFDIVSETIRKNVLTEKDLKTENAIELNRKATEIQTALGNIGLNFSKTLIKFSLVNIDMVNNPEKEFSPKSAASKLIKNNPVLSSTGAYLKKDFFVWLNKLGPNINIFERTDYDVIDVDPEDLEERDVLKVERTKDQKTAINGINGILRDAARFSIKYNPDAAVSVFQDANGKNVYRYLKYTPLLLMAQTVNTKGLDGLIEEYPVLSEWFKANPFYTISKDKELKLYLSNFKISMLGGVRQSIDGVEKDGVTFKNIDPRSKQVADLLMFANRKIIRSGKTEIVTYDRSHSILEATSTNFLVTGMYKQMVTLNKETGEINFQQDEKDNIIVIDMMLKGIQQEYERIQREWASRNESKQRYEDYNVKKLADGTIDTTSPNLRAYTFCNFFQKFFGKTSYQHPDATTNSNRIAIGDELIELAKGGIPFKDILKKSSYDKTIGNLKDLLLGYAQDEFKDYLDSLDKNGVIKYLPKGNSFVSSLIPTSIKIGHGNFSSLEEMGHNNFSFLADYFYNDWTSRMFTSQFFDGDTAITVKNSTLYGFRNRFAVIKGDSMREGFHTVAYINKLKIWMHKTDITAGQYDSKDDIPQEYKEDDNWENNWEQVDVADGMSYQTLEHRIFMYGRQGRLEKDNSLDKDDKLDVYGILQKARIERLSKEEVEHLEKFKIVLGSYKTATGGMIEYHKLSEHILLRPDVSYLDLNGMKREEVIKLLKDLYSQVDMVKEHIINGDEYILLPEHNTTPREALKSLYANIHKFWKARPGRESLHYTLNSMEMSGIDQLIDINGSKKGTLMPVDLNLNDITDLSIAAKTVPNKYKYMQVETSGVSHRITNPSQKQQLIDADIDTNKESSAPKRLIEAVKEYRKTLELYSKLSLDEIKLILDRPEGDVDINSIISTMRKGLEKQGADANILKLFEINPVTNKPEFNINLPMRRTMFQNYFFALYSDNVFGSKVAGRKDFIVSSYGYKLVVDQNDRVIRQDEIDKNPSKYANYKTRYPGISVEIDEKGDRIYVVEVIVPKPLFESDQHEEIFWTKLDKMISTRIPTEDKRSMLVSKVVDTMDSAYQNSILLPQLVHKLSGSDLDIDSLFSQMFATYKDFEGNTHIYGDYSTHPTLSTEEAKFLEYIIDRSESDVFEGNIDLEYDRIMSNPDAITELPEALHRLKDQLGFPGLGINKENIRERIRELNQARQSYYTSYQSVKEERQKVFDEYTKLRQRNEATWNEAFNQVVKGLKEAGEKIVDENSDEFKESVVDLVYQKLAMNGETVEWKKQGALSSALRSKQQAAKNTFETMTGMNVEYNEASREARRVITMFQKQMRVLATLNVLAEFKQPVTIDAFKKRTVELVKPVVQNRNMAAQIKILSHEYVFNNLYRNEAANVKFFKKLGESIGESIDTNIEQYDRHSPAFVANVLGINSNSEGGIGIAATANKAAAFLTKFKVKLARPIWEINGRTYNSYEAFSVNGEDIQRTIKVIGEALGMFADAKKEPYPSILNLTETTSGITLGMISVGIPKEAAYLINLVPLIKKAVIESERSTSSVQTVEEYRQRNNLKKLLKKEMAVAINELKKKNRLDELFRKNKEGALIDSFREIKISFEFDPAPRKRETVNDLGFTATYKDNGEEVQNDVLEIHLLGKYISEIGQNADVLQLGSILNLIKKQEPSWENLDKVVRAYMYLTNRLQDKPNFANMKQVLEKEAKEYIPKLDSIMHLYTTSEKVFLERNAVFKIINEQVGSSIWGFGMSDNLKSNLNSYAVKYLMLNKFKIRTKEQLDQEIASKNPNLDKVEMLSNRLSILSADFWMNKDTSTTPTFEDEIIYLQKNNPGNAFANFLKTNSLNGIIFVEALSRMKLDSELSNNIIDGFVSLQRSLDQRTRLIADKLYTYLLVKDNLALSNNSFIQYLNPGLYKSVSQDLDDIQSTLNKALRSPKNREKIIKGEPFKKFFNNESLDMPSFLATIFYKQLSNASQKPFLHSSRKFVPGVLTGPLSNRLSRLNKEDFLDLLSKVAPKATEIDFNKLYNIEGAEDRVYDVYTPSETTIDKGEVIVDASVIGDPGDSGLPKLQEELTRALKIIPAYQYDRDGKKTFIGWDFPATVVNSEGQLLRLDTIDGKPIGAYLIEKLNDRLTHTKLNSDFKIAGFKAVYKVSQFESTPKIMNTAFSTEEARDLYEFNEISKTYSMVKTTDEMDKFMLKLYNDYDVPSNQLELLQRWLKKDYDKYGYVKLGNKGVFSIKYSVPVSEFEKDNEYLIEITPDPENPGSSYVTAALYSVTNGARRLIGDKESFRAVEDETMTKQERKAKRLEEQKKKNEEKFEEELLKRMGMTREEAIEAGFIKDRSAEQEEISLTKGEQFSVYSRIMDYINTMTDRREAMNLITTILDVNESKKILKAVGGAELFNNISPAIMSRMDAGFDESKAIPGEVELPDFLKDILNKKEVSPTKVKTSIAGFTEDELQSLHKESNTKKEYDTWKKAAIELIDEGFKYGLNKKSIADTLKNCL